MKQIQIFVLYKKALHLEAIVNIFPQDLEVEFSEKIVQFNKYFNNESKNIIIL